MNGAGRLGVVVDNPLQLGLAGLGVVGSSIGMAARAAGYSVVGYDISSSTAERARDRGAVDAVVRSVDDLGSTSIDLVVVAVPPAATVATVHAVVAAGARAVTDVASVKRETVHALAGERAFLGGHPMAGSEQNGPDAARANLFVGASWFLTPSAATSLETKKSVLALVSALNAHAIWMDASRHDRAAALLSHLPHVAAAALVNVIAHDPDAAEIGHLVGSGWRDTTRVASGIPGLWTEILCSNAAIVATIDAYVAELAAIREGLVAADAPKVHDWLQCAAVARHSLQDLSPLDRPAAAKMALGAHDGGLVARPSFPRDPLPWCTCRLPKAGQASFA